MGKTVSVTLGELVATDPKVTAPLADWRSVTEFSISPSGTVVRDGQVVKAEGKAWAGPREIRNLRWEGGAEPSQPAPNVTLSPADFERDFDGAIKKTLKQEQLDAKQ